MGSRARVTFQALCALSLVVVPACGDSEGSPGEVENGTFAYVCTSGSDSRCDYTDDLVKMPENVAVGASFGVKFLAVTDAARDGSAAIVAVSEELLSRETGTDAVFTALRPGFVGILAMRGSSVVDVIHVRLAEVKTAYINVLRDPPNTWEIDSSFAKVIVGGYVSLRAVVVDDTDGILAGSLPYQWTGGESAIAEITSSLRANEILVKGNAKGTTTLRVTVNGTWSEDITIIVVDPPPPPEEEEMKTAGSYARSTIVGSP